MFRFLHEILFNLNHNHYLYLQVLEEKRLGQERNITELFLPIPEPQELFDGATVTPMTFATFSKQSSGRIDVKMGWSTTVSSCNVSDNCNFTRKLRKPIADNHETIQQWFDDELLDPLDPDTASLTLQMLRKDPIAHPTQTDEKSMKLFRLNEDQTAFCSADVILLDKRLNLLADRFNADLKFKDRKFVPNTERELIDFEKTDDEGPSQCIEDLEWMDPIDMQRHRGKKYLRNMYRTLTNYCDILSRSADAQDLLIGDDIPTFG